MNRREFIDSLPTENGEYQEAAKLLGKGKAALSRWVRRPVADRTEAVLLRGWELLTPDQRAEALRG